MKKFSVILFSLLFVAGTAMANTWLPDNIKHSNTLTSHVPTVSTVANVPTCNSAATGKLAVVTDGANATDCATGAGSTVNTCVCNGSAYVDVA